MSATASRAPVDVAEPRSPGALALLLAVLSVPGSILFWDAIPGGGFVTGLPLAVAAIVLGLRDLRRAPMSRGKSIAAVVIAGLIMAMMLAWTLASVASADAAGFNSGQRRRADKLISNFENSTSVIQYCYVEALGDGRGYTVGRAGFTSRTGDLLEVVEKYTDGVGQNALAPLLPRLRGLYAANSGSTAGLEKLPDAWRATCNDPRQRRVQDSIVNREYYRPALRQWRNLRLRTALSLAAIYDAEIQHGPGDDPDGVPAMMRRTKRRAHGTPRTGVRESRFLRAFLKVRKATLLNPHDRSTRDEWRESVGRVSAFSYLVRTRQWRLSSPLRVNTRLYPHLRLR